MVASSMSEVHVGLYTIFLECALSQAHVCVRLVSSLSVRASLAG